MADRPSIAERGENRINCIYRLFQKDILTAPAKSAAAKTKPASKARPVKASSTPAPTPVSVAASAKPVPASKPIKPSAPKPAVSKKAVDVKAKLEKPAKPKKPKLVRDSFTIPKTEYVVLEALKQRAVGLAQPAKKSELLRAGIKALAAMSDTDLRAALQAVPAIKTGRPASEKAD
jgi:hypothetical protein